MTQLVITVKYADRTSLDSWKTDNVNNVSAIFWVLIVLRDLVNLQLVSVIVCRMSKDLNVMNVSLTIGKLRAVWDVKLVHAMLLAR